MDTGLDLATGTRLQDRVSPATMLSTVSDVLFVYVGYYAVHLESHDVFAELTAAGQFTGVHRYTFNNTKDKKFLLFDITHSVQEVWL